MVTQKDSKGQVSFKRQCLGDQHALRLRNEWEGGGDRGESGQRGEEDFNVPLRSLDLVQLKARTQHGALNPSLLNSTSLGILCLLLAY